MENLFDIFFREWSLPTIQQAFYQLCINRGVDPTDYTNVYEKLKQADRFCDNSFKQKQLWDLLDKRRQQKVYQNQTVCRGMNVLIVGAGPCGLRAAIECALLGAHVVVIDSRDKFTRNNVLHLWKFVIEDLRGLGAKVFMPKFCTGSIEHISIRKLQFILLKVALVLGVQFYDRVIYKDLHEPQDGKGWRAIFEPSDHILSDYEFDVIIGASGKSKCLPAFKHNPVRGKLAIGVTANFVRHHNKEEDSVPEIQGVAYVYRQDYFDDLERKTNISLENIVYYKGDTHYFVMCGKKQNLLQKKVLKSDKEDARALLDRENVDEDMLCKYVTQVVDYVTDGRLGQLEFALNARKRPDVAAFDFTTLESADHSTRFVKYMGHPLILTLVGDYLHEPFWPTGSGAARGFLSVLDTAWLLRGVGLEKEPMAKLLAEREGVYSLLSQTQPSNLSTAYHAYTIDPRKRYTQFKPSTPFVEHLMGSDDDHEDLNSTLMQIRRQSATNVEFLQRCSLFRFCYMAALSQKIRISNFKRSSWLDGCALAALILKYNPDFAPSVPVTSMTNPSQLCLESFQYAEEKLGVPRPCRTHTEWASMKERDRIAYLQKLADVLRANPFYTKNCLSPTLLINYKHDKALASAIQARILRPKQTILQADDGLLNNTAFNFSILDASDKITVRAKRPRIEDSVAAGALNRTTGTTPLKRSSIEPLNPELVYKIDKIASGSYTRRRSSQHQLAVKTSSKPADPPQTQQQIADDKGPATRPHDDQETRAENVALEEVNDDAKPSKLDETLTRGSLAGVKNVSRFRHKFDASKPEAPPRQRTVSKTPSNSTTSSQVSSASESNSNSGTEEDYPADPMNARRINHPQTVRFAPTPENATSTSNSERSQGVVYRSATQHHFSTRRPISTPSALNSPELYQTYGQRIAPSTASAAAQQNVYKTVSQRRMKLCALCNREVYLAEQLIVDDRLCVHRNCFKCAFCSRSLEIGKAFVDRSFMSEFGVRWYCTQHNARSSGEKLQQLRKMMSRQNIAVVSPTKTKQRPDSTAIASYPQKVYVASSAESTDSSTTSLNELGAANKTLTYDPASMTLLTNNGTQTTPRPATPPKKANRPSNSSRYRKRLSELNSPTQLIEACKERTNQRLVSLGLKNLSIDENTELGATYANPNGDLAANTHHADNSSSSSSHENDNLSNGSYEEADGINYGTDETENDEEEDDNFVDAEDDFLSDDAADPQMEHDEAWNELKSFLEKSLADSSGNLSDPNIEQARELVETFNRRSILSHFNDLQAIASTQQPPPPKALDPKTPYFTPRQSRAETAPDTTSIAVEQSSEEKFYTPRTTLRAPAILRRSSTTERTPAVVDQLKQEIHQNARQFAASRPVKPPPPTNGSVETPRRTKPPPSRYHQRGPRRATVAIDLKRESLAPDDVVATKNLSEQQKSEATVTTSANNINNQAPATSTKIRRSPSVQQRRRALHIRPNDENLGRVLREIEAVRNRRRNERERQLQALQRRMDEIEVRIEQVSKVGVYLERSLRKEPRNRWELEQWLIYSQQYEELRDEEHQLKLKLRIAHLEDEYQTLKRRLHSIQQSGSSDTQNEDEKTEKELMQRLLDLLNQKDTVKAELNELQSEARPRTPPSELVKRAPSYTCYAPVFLREEESTRSTTNANGSTANPQLQSHKNPMEKRILV